MTWKNGDTEPDRLPAACLARAPPAEKPRDGALHRWVEVYWAGDAKWFLGRVVGEREGELKIADTGAQIKLSRRGAATAEAWPPRHRRDISTTAWRCGLSPLDLAGTAARARLTGRFFAAGLHRWGNALSRDAGRAVRRRRRAARDRRLRSRAVALRRGAAAAQETPQDREGDEALRPARGPAPLQARLPVPVPPRDDAAPHVPVGSRRERRRQGAPGSGVAEGGQRRLRPRPADSEPVQDGQRRPGPRLGHGHDGRLRPREAGARGDRTGQRRLGRPSRINVRPRDGQLAPRREQGLDGDDAGGRVPRTVEIRRARRRELSVVARGGRELRGLRGAPLGPRHAEVRGLVPEPGQAPVEVPAGAPVRNRQGRRGVEGGPVLEGRVQSGLDLVRRR